MITKIILQSFLPIEILFYRFVIGYAFLWIVSPKFLRTKNRREELYYALAGGVGVTLYFLLELNSLKHTTASNISIILAASPFFVAIISHFLLRREKLSFRFFVGFTCAMSGIVLIATNGHALNANPLGDLLAISAALCWAAFSLIMKEISLFGYNTIQSTRRVFFYGLLFLLPVIMLTDFRFGLERFGRPLHIFCFAYLGCGASALCFVTWSYAIKAIGAVKATAYIYAVPVITIVAAIVVLKEQLTPIVAAGAFLTLTGLLISETKGKKERAQSADNSH